MRASGIHSVEGSAGFNRLGGRATPAPAAPARNSVQRATTPRGVAAVLLCCSVAVACGAGLSDDPRGSAAGGANGGRVGSAGTGGVGSAGTRGEGGEGLGRGGALGAGGADRADRDAGARGDGVGGADDAADPERLPPIASVAGAAGVDPAGEPRRECDLPCPEATACSEFRPLEASDRLADSPCPACERLPAPPGKLCGIGLACDRFGDCQPAPEGRVAAGPDHACAIVDGGRVLCWGRNELGQLGAAFDRPVVGDDEAPASLSESRLDFGRRVVQLSAGQSHTCALLEDGAVRCWGGLSEVTAALLRAGELDGPDPLTALLGTSQVARNEAGFVDPLATSDVALDEPALSVVAATSGWYSCAVLESGRLSCWGDNELGQLGLGESGVARPRPGERVPVAALEVRVEDVAGGPSHACAVLEGGQLTCWGRGRAGQLGLAYTSTQLAPGAPVHVGVDVARVVAGSESTCVVSTEGRVRCWGANDRGQLGYGHVTPIGDTRTPEQAAQGMLDADGRRLLGGNVRIAGATRAVQVEPIAGSRSFCALLQSGSVRCWGQNDRGQLGYGHAVELSELYTPELMAGRIGDGDRNGGGDVDFGLPALALASGGRCALLAGGAVTCWGDNQDGKLGHPELPADVSRARLPREIGPVPLSPP